MALYLVTGAAGFIGSSLVRELIRRGEQVRGLDNLETGKHENLAPVLNQMEFFEIDIRDEERLPQAFKGVDYVLHQAALPSVPLSVANPVRSHTININGTFNVLLAARDAGVKRVVYAGSSSAYGETLTLPKREDMLPSPVSPYAVQKLTGEYYARCFTKVYSLPAVCLRYFNVFGPRQDPSSPYSGVLAKFIRQMLAGESPTIFGDGEQTRDFTYVEDVTALIWKAATVPGVGGRMYNAGNGNRYSLNHVWDSLQKIEGVSIAPKYGPPRAGDVRDSQADTTAARRDLGHDPQYTLEQGLHRTLAWYKTC